MDKPIYFSKIEFKNNFLQDCEGTMLLNLVEKELSYQLVKRHRKNEKILLDEIGENSVSIYIGIPFCPTRCLYCSFVSTDIRVSGKYMDPFVDK